MKIYQKMKLKNYIKILDLFEEYNTPLKTRVTNNFVEIFDEIGGRVYESTIEREEFENKKYELENI